MNRTLLALFAGALIVLAGCGGGGGGNSSSESPSSFSISGTVNGAVLSGVTITLSGTSSGTATTDGSGNYSFSGLVNGPYTVTPSITGYTFTPTSKAVTISGANATAINFTAATTRLSLFTDRVKSCTPYLSIGSLSSATSSLLDNWNSWSPDVSGSVLGKLFDPANGKDECIYSQVQVLDSHINLVNQFSDRWLTSGTYTQGTMTAVVDTTFTTVTIPIIGLDTQDTMNRLVTLSDSAQNLMINMAFYQSGGNQTIVEQYVMGNAVSAAFYARVVGSDVQIWFAGIGDHKVQGMWEGNTSAKTFKISECTNASAGNWEVMGGGSIASSTSEMSFMARNNQNTNSSDSDTYYITTTWSSLENGTLQTILNALATPPNPITDSAQAYITGGNDSCLGFLGIDQYPNTLEDLAWVQ